MDDEDLPTRSRPSRGRDGRAPHTRGPRDRSELVDWLAEDDYTVVSGGKHWLVLSPTGGRVYALSRTPSDRRTLANEVAALRKITGLPLRRS